MTGIFGKIFGGKKKAAELTPATVIEKTLQGILEAAKFELDFDLDEENGEYYVELYGNDEELLKAKEGQLLDSLQLFTKRVLQHQFPDDNIHVNMDSDGFREKANEELLDLADKLKGIALDKGKSVYFRALPPKDRKIVHQYLAEDGRVKSRSVGEGHFKKIKIYPVKGKSDQTDDQQPAQ
jgi:spoIIIJ-associated protein